MFFFRIQFYMILLLGENWVTLKKHRKKRDVENLAFLVEVIRGGWWFGC